MFRKLVKAVLIAGAAVALAVAPAYADSPHFVRSSASLNGDGTLTVAFKEAGLGTNQLIAYEASADASATYVCVNNGGANPSAQNKTTVAGPVSAFGSFSSGKNGQVTASLTIDPPASTLDCPPGQREATAEVSYTNVAIADLTNGVSEAVEGEFASGCLLPDVRGACD